jgi:hypothetical protein
VVPLFQTSTLPTLICSQKKELFKKYPVQKEIIDKLAYETLPE